MKDNDCIRFLQWALPKLHMRWKGFRKVRKRVCRRIQKRMNELKIEEFEGYKQYLDENRSEWEFLDSYCRVSISRFYRDKGLFDIISKEIIPLLVHTAFKNYLKQINVWSIGCASGEEPYTVKIIWENAVRAEQVTFSINILATDINRTVLKRACEGVYSKSSFWELPENMLNEYFYRDGQFYKIKKELKCGINFVEQDVRKYMPEGRFHVILCRNLVFTYFDKELQLRILTDLEKHLVEGGFLIIGSHEKLPNAKSKLKKNRKNKMIYCKNSIKIL